MVSRKQLADFGYKAFSGSMMLLTVYAGYLCSVRVQRLLQQRRQRESERERQLSSAGTGAGS